MYNLYSILIKYNFIIIPKIFETLSVNTIFSIFINVVELN